MDEFGQGFAEPGNVLAHVAGLLLVCGFLLTSIRNLRILALAAGIGAVVHFAFLAPDGIGLLWSTLFVAANAAGLAILAYRARTGIMLPNERELIEHVLKVEEPTQQRRLRDLIEWRDVASGEVLMRQGQVGPPLIFVASGAAAIEHDGKPVGACGAGDFLGEMSLVSGSRASATVIATQTMRIARLDRDTLLGMSNAMPELSRAFDHALNRGMAAKLTRMNAAISAKAGQSA